MSKGSRNRSASRAFWESDYWKSRIPEQECGGLAESKQVKRGCAKARKDKLCVCGEINMRHCPVHGQEEER